MGQVEERGDFITAGLDYSGPFVEQNRNLDRVAHWKDYATRRVLGWQLGKVFPNTWTSCKHFQQFQAFRRVLTHLGYLKDRKDHEYVLRIRQTVLSTVTRKMHHASGLAHCLERRTVDPFWLQKDLRWEEWSPLW